MVVQRITSCSKKKMEICFFPKKEKRKKKRNLISKKKKIILFQKSSSLELRLDLILYDRGRQPCKGPVPFTQTILSHYFEFVLQGYLGAAYVSLS